MFGSKEIKHIFGNVTIVAFAILLLLTPCKVRKSIQAFFEVEQTESSNKGLTSLESLNCVKCELPTIEVTKLKKTTQHFSPEITLVYYSTSLSSQYGNSDSKKIVNHSNSKLKIPLYLLFHSFTFYS